MTDDVTAAERAERIRRLQERRAATSVRTAASTTTSTAHSATVAAKSRRRQPATRTRVLLAGISVASFLGIAGSIGLAHSGTSATVAKPVASTPAVAPLASATANATPSPASRTIKAARAGASSNSAPNVTTRGS